MNWPKQGMVFAIASICAVGSGLAAQKFLSSKAAAIEASHKAGSSIKLLVANEDLARGAKISTQSVSIRAVPEEWVHGDAIRADQFDRQVQIVNEKIQSDADVFAPAGPRPNARKLRESVQVPVQACGPGRDRP